ncbi:MAG: DUF2071 domain-containing protein [Armatimonadetes bacterium]|nr:DUF2071 domain-containing protein [Armatimonadota bacterium]
MEKQAGTFLTAEWRYLAMVNYRVDPSLLASYVPPGTELDAWNGIAYLSIVGFLFQDTRVKGFAIPLHREFEEVNLRFYVRRLGPEGWRRGVAFIREIVPRRAIALIARAVYGEPYLALPMRHRIDLDPRTGSLEDGGAVEYGWRTSAGWNTLQVVTTGAAEPLREGSEEEFITEHYWGYTARRGGSAEYRVEHPPWRVWQSDRASVEVDVEAIYGPEFVEPLSAPLHSAFVAEGSPVRVNAGARM